MKLKLLAFLAIAAATSSFASTNPVGVNYVGMEIGYGRLSDLGPDISADGLLGSIGYNYAINNEGNVGLDWFTNVSYARISGGIDTGHTQSVGTRLRAYLNREAIRPFLQAGASFNWHQESGAGILRDDSWGLAVGFGAEVPFSETFSLIYLVEWAGLERDVDNHFRFGVGAHKWITDSVGLSLNYALAEGPIKQHRATLGINVRL